MNDYLMFCLCSREWNGGVTCGHTAEAYTFSIKWTHLHKFLAHQREPPLQVEEKNLFISQWCTRPLVQNGTVSLYQSEEQVFYLQVSDLWWRWSSREPGAANQRRPWWSTDWLTAAGRVRRAGTWTRTKRGWTGHELERQDKKISEKASELLNVLSPFLAVSVYFSKNRSNSPLMNSNSNRK